MVDQACERAGNSGRGVSATPVDLDQYNKIPCRSLRLLSSEAVTLDFDLRAVCFRQSESEGVARMRINTWPADKVQANSRPYGGNPLASAPAYPCRLLCTESTPGAVISTTVLLGTGDTEKVIDHGEPT